MTSLLSGLSEMGRQHEYILYSDRPDRHTRGFVTEPFYKKCIGNFPLLRSPLIWQQLVLPAAVWRDGIDVLVSPYYCGPIYSPVPHVVFLYDVSFMEYPDDFPRWPKFKPKLLARPSCRTADLVVTISEFSQSEIGRHLGLPPGKVAIVRPGKDLKRMGDPSSQNASKVFRELGKNPFFLFVGTLLPRRQVGRVLEALSMLPSEYHFVVVGDDDEDRLRMLNQKGRSFGLADRMHVLGHVSDYELEEAYEGASALISPSIYEGFGLPLLEAMVRRVPIIVWDIPINREVVGDAGVLIRVGDVKNLASSMLEVATNDDWRRELGERGYTRAGSFSWESSTSSFLGLLEEKFLNENDG